MSRILLQSLGLALLLAAASIGDTNAPLPSPSAALGVKEKSIPPTNTPASNAPVVLQSVAAKHAAPPQATISPQVAFLEGVRVGAALGRRNPDMTSEMLVAAGNLVWQQEMDRLAAAAKKP